MLLLVLLLMSSQRPLQPLDMCGSTDRTTSVLASDSAARQHREDQAIGYDSSSYFVEEWAGGVRGKGKGVEGKSGKRKKGTKMERVKVRNRKKEKKEKGEEK